MLAISLMKQSAVLFILNIGDKQGVDYNKDTNEVKTNKKKVDF